MLSTREEVINNYLLWEFSKPYIRSLIVEYSPSENKIEQIIQRVRGCIESGILSFNEKLGLVRHFSPQSNRANLFSECSWTLRKDYPMQDLGTVLPVCGDLPINIIAGPFSDVVEYVKKRQNEPNQEKSVRYITSLMKIPNVLMQFPVIVIEPGGLQRNVRVMEDYHGPGNWKIHPTSGYIEDGNHRAVAIAIAHDLKLIPCYVGRARRKLSFFL